MISLAACGGDAVPTASPDSTSSVSAEPDSLLGFFDLEEYEQLYYTTFTTDNVTDMTAIRYRADFEYPLSLDLMIEPDDPDKAIIQTSFSFDSADEWTGIWRKAQETWFDVTDDYQPEAVGWIRQHLDEYLAAPGAAVSNRQAFGDACAGFFTLDPHQFDLSPDPLDPNFGKATSIGYFVEDSSINGC